MTQHQLVLLVEDNEANQLLARTVLELEGFRVDVAASVDQARDVMQVRLPDLIVMDVQLPGEDGLSFARQLKAEAATSHIPVVALTALAMPGDRARTLEAGCSGYLSKPIDTRTFGREVRAYVRSTP